jgi:Ca2+-binding RTX toxin-like protein
LVVGLCALVVVSVAQARYLSGTAGADVLIGTPGRDRISGRRGDDRIAGRAGADWVEAGHDADVVFGGEGKDVLFGGPGEDRLTGGAGADAIEGNAGDDVLDARDPRGRRRLSDCVPCDPVPARADLVLGGAGNDHVFADDGRLDAINCGSGFDRVRMDRGDRLIVFVEPSACELVERR